MRCTNGFSSVCSVCACSCVFLFRLILASIAPSCLFFIFTSEQDRVPISGVYQICLRYESLYAMKIYRGGRCCKLQRQGPIKSSSQSRFSPCQPQSLTHTDAVLFIATGWQQTNILTFLLKGIMFYIVPNSKVTGYKIKAHKSVVFIYTNDKLPGK